MGRDADRPERVWTLVPGADPARVGAGDRLAADRVAGSAIAITFAMQGTLGHDAATTEDLDHEPDFADPVMAFLLGEPPAAAPNDL